MRKIRLLMTPQMKITFPRTVSRVVREHILCQWTHWRDYLSVCTACCAHWLQKTWHIKCTAGLNWQRWMGAGKHPEDTYLLGLCASCTALLPLHAFFLRVWRVSQTQSGWYCDAFQSQSFGLQLLSLQRKAWHTSPGYMRILDPGLWGWPV